MIAIRCQTCGWKHHVTENLEGSWFKCECGETYRVPSLITRTPTLPKPKPTVVSSKLVVTKPMSKSRFTIVMCAILAALMMFTCIGAARFATMSADDWQIMKDRFTSEQALRDEYTAGMRVLTDAKKNGTMLFRLGSNSNQPQF